MDVERLLRDVAERGLMALPSERTNRQIGIDPFDRTGVERAVGLGRDAAERDALRGQRLLDGTLFGLGSGAGGVRLGAQLGAHLPRQTGDRPEPEHLRGIALIGGARPLAVAAHERVLRLRPGAVGSALRVAAEACECVGPSGRAQVHTAQARRVADRAPGGMGIRTARRRR